MSPRSFHFIPAHKPRLFDRLDRLGADHYIFDLEDAVPPAEKAAARNFLRDFFRQADPARFSIRINEAGHPELEKDLPLLRELPTVGVVVPKYCGAAHLQELDRRAGLHQRRLILMVESFEAAAHLPQILGQLPYQILGVGLGFEDLFAAVPQRSADLASLAGFIRAALAVQCRAHAWLAIDGISAADEPPLVFERHCEEGRACGLHGKFSIHPRQIDPINRLFSPASDLVRWAERVAELTGLRDDFGYEQVGDLLITPPKIKKARYILESKAS